MSRVACMCFTVRDKVVPRPRPRRIYANFNGVELVIFQGSYLNSLYSSYTRKGLTETEGVVNRETYEAIKGANSLV